MIMVTETLRHLGLSGLIYAAYVRGSRNDLYAHICVLYLLFIGYYCNKA